MCIEAFRAMQGIFCLQKFKDIYRYKKLLHKIPLGYISSREYFLWEFIKIQTSTMGIEAFRARQGIFLSPQIQSYIVITSFHIKSQGYIFSMEHFLWEFIKIQADKESIQTLQTYFVSTNSTKNNTFIKSLGNTFRSNYCEKICRKFMKIQTRKLIF